MYKTIEKIDNMSQELAVFILFFSWLTPHFRTTSTFQNTILLNMSKRNSGVQVHNLILHLQILHWILQTFIFSHQMQIF